MAHYRFDKLAVFSVGLLLVAVVVVLGAGLWVGSEIAAFILDS